MGDVINLNQFRKNRERSAARRKAAANRVQSGRTRQERDLVSHAKDVERKTLEDKRLEPASETDDKPDAG